MSKTCSFDGCAGNVNSRAASLCSVHLTQKYTGKPLRPTKIDDKECSFPGCENACISKGLCKGHYMQQYRGVELRPLRQKTSELRKKTGCKWCPGCKENIAVENFSINSRRGDGLDGYCKKCVLLRQRKYGRTSNYGISLEKYISMLEEQGGSCFLCGEKNVSGRALAINHDHSCCPGKKSCGKCVRKLLCRNCNLGLGLFKDRPELLMAAATYIKEHKRGD